MSSMRIQELTSAVSFNRQAALQTALLAASFWKLRQSNNQIGQPEHVFENDSDDLGKGDEWVTQNFPSHINAPRQWDYLLTSENAAMLAVFGLGKFAQSGDATDGYKYTCTFSDPCEDGLDVPTVTMLQSINQCVGNTLFDYALIGMALEEWTIRLQQGVGRQNATMQSSWQGCGKYSEPSGVDVSAQEMAVEHRLGAGSATVLTLMGRNYLTLKQFVDFQFGVQKALRLDDGFYPGSGQQNGFDIRGRMQHGKRSATLQATVHMAAGSPELDDLLAFTEGTAQLTMQGAAIGAGYHGINVNWHRIQLTSHVIGESNGIVTVALAPQIMKHATNGVMTMEVTCEKGGIGALAA